jgi:hypothetical protein
MRMTRKLTLVATVALAGLVGSPAARAQGDGEEPSVDAPAAETPAQAPTAGEPGDGDGDGAELGGGDYDRQLLTIEEEVHSLKEQVFRAKATLQLLKEIVVQGTSAGSRATVWHENKLGRGYTVESIAYYLDGQGKFSKADPTGGLDEMREFKVFEGAVPPGAHNVTVNIRLRGNGFGVFSYVKDYTFNVQSSHSFVAEEGKNCSVRVVSDERRGIGRSFTERPNVQFETTCTRLTDAAGSSE